MKLIKKGEIMFKLIYTVFLGVLIALFIGWGIEVFYNSPKMPEYPTELQYAKSDLTTEQRAIQEKYDKDMKVYQDKNKDYSKKISMIVVAISIVLFALSLVVLKNIPFLSDSVLLGAIFTLLYGIIRGLASGNNKVQFASIAVGLVIAFIVGYLKFMKAAKAN